MTDPQPAADETAADDAAVAAVAVERRVDDDRAPPRPVAGVPPAKLPPADPAAAANGAVFSQQMCEVQLLLDFLSGSPALRLPDADAAARAKLPPDWIEQICRIGWPPEGTPAAQADQEALLVKVKDYLNSIANPANGASVAFTLLVAQEDNAGDAPVTVAPGDQGQAATGYSRNGLARTAFPGLVSKSRGFRQGMFWLRIGLTAWLVLTCCLSWYAALGNARLAQLSAASTAQDTARAQLIAPQVTPAAAAEAVAPAEADADAAAPVAPAPVAPAVVAPAVVAPAAAPAVVAAGGPVTSCDPAAKGPQTAEQAAVCSELAAAADRVTAAQSSFRMWWVFGGRSGSAKAMVDDATSALGVLGTGVLPVCYGILGAAAAVLRLLSGRMRLSLLMPRDLTLALQQLALGAVVGACIGLFVTPGADGVLGTVSLSSAALSFIAGFGVDAVFATLEGLIARLFNIAPPAAPVTAAAAEAARSASP